MSKDNKSKPKTFKSSMRSSKGRTAGKTKSRVSNIKVTNSNSGKGISVPCEGEYRWVEFKYNPYGAYGGYDNHQPDDDDGQDYSLYSGSLIPSDEE